MPDYRKILSEDCPAYADYSPTAFDSAGLGLPDRATWRVLPVIRTRDSGVLDRSNFRTALASLATVDPGGEHYETHRFGHWGCGWFEIILVNPDAPDTVIDAAGGIVAALANYPILSEEDYSDLQSETADAAWLGMSIRDRIHACARYRVSIFAARRECVPESPTGELDSYLAEE